MTRICSLTPSSQDGALRFTWLSKPCEEGRMGLVMQLRYAGAAEPDCVLYAADIHPAGHHNKVPLPANMDNFAVHAEKRIGID